MLDEDDEQAVKDACQHERIERDSDCEGSHTSVAGIFASSVKGINGIGLVARRAELLEIVLDLIGLGAAEGLLVGRVLEFAVTGQ